MPKSKTIYPLFGDKHKDYIKRATRCTLSVAEGAVRAGKTIDNIAAFAWMIEHGTPDRIHLVTGATVGTAKLNIGDANGFGLEYIFRGRCRWGKYKDNEALFITSKGRDYVVIFVGGGKADSFKRIRGNSYGMWLATEINLHHPDTIKEAFNRQLAARVRRIFWDLNPTNPGHWIYKDYINRFPETFPGRYNYEHFTIFDNASIPLERIEEIKRQYIPGSVWYRRDIEGERCIAEGLVYPMFEQSLENEQEENQWYDYRISIDYGTLNPFAALKWKRDRDGIWHVTDEYYYSGRESGTQKTDADYLDDLVAFTADNANNDIPIYIDPSAASMKAALWRCDDRSFRVIDADNDVSDGIRETATCMKSGLIKISRTCTHTIEELQGYVWDNASTTDKPVKENDHAMDAMRYFVHTMRLYRPDQEYTSLLGGRTYR